MDATTHNIVSPTMVGVVGTCCVVHANEHINCQFYWRTSKEAMHSGTVLLLFLINIAIRVPAGVLLWFHENGRNIVAIYLTSHRTKGMLELVAPKV